MAYPMAPSMTCLELRRRLEEEEGAEFIRDDETGLSYLQRTFDGDVLYAPFPYPDAEMATPSVIRSTCRMLAVEPESFGFNLG